MNLRHCHEQVEHLKMDTNVGNNFEFQQIGNRTTTTTVIITFALSGGNLLFYQQPLSEEALTFLLGTVSSRLINIPSIPLRAHCIPSFYGISLFPSCMTSQLEPLYLSQPSLHNWISSCPLWFSSRFCIPFCFFRLHFDSRLLSRRLHLLVTAASQPDKTEANCPWDLIQIHLFTNSL